MRNLYNIFDESIEREEFNENKKIQKINDKIKKFNEAVKIIKENDDLYNYFYDTEFYIASHLSIIKEIINNITESTKENNIEFSYKFKKILYDFELNSVNRLYSKVSSLNDENMNETLISIFNNIKNFELREIPNEINSEMDKDIKIMIENNIKVIDSKIKLLEEQNINLLMNYEKNEIRAYYAYKLFIQMLMDKLYNESINNSKKNILEKEISYRIDFNLSEIILKESNLDIIKFPKEVLEHFKEYVKLFVERNNIMYSSNFQDRLESNNYLYLDTKIKKLLDASYREIQGFEYTDELIEEFAKEENIKLGKDCENPLTLKIK